VLNWEKCHFIVKQGIVLGHVKSERGIEVCRCLNLSTSIGGTRSKVEGGDRHDLESKVRARTQDTRFIQVRVAGVATLRPVWSSIASCAWVLFPEGLWMFG
jgi:hypothetical protein